MNARTWLSSYTTFAGISCWGHDQGKFYQHPQWQTSPKFQPLPPDSHRLTEKQEPDLSPSISLCPEKTPTFASQVATPQSKYYFGPQCQRADVVDGPDMCGRPWAEHRHAKYSVGQANTGHKRVPAQQGSPEAAHSRPCTNWLRPRTQCRAGSKWKR